MLDCCCCYLKMGSWIKWGRILTFILKWCLMMLKIVLLSLYELCMTKVDSFRDLYDEKWCFYDFLSKNPKQRLFSGLSSLGWAPWILQRVLNVHGALPRNRPARLASISEPASLTLAWSEKLPGISSLGLARSRLSDGFLMKFYYKFNLMSYMLITWLDFDLITYYRIELIKSWDDVDITCS
jgi:hypothetical protein